MGLFVCLILLGSLISPALTEDIDWEAALAYHTGSPAACPVVDGEAFYADPQKRACCPAPDGMEVVLATGPDNKATAACCLISSSCTGPVPALADWSMVTSGNFYLPYVMLTRELIPMQLCRL